MTLVGKHIENSDYIPQHMTDELKEKILNKSKTIVIVGLSPDSNKPSYGVAKYLIERGKIIVPIYPKGEEILGQKVFHSLLEAFTFLKQTNRTCDIVNIFRKSQALPQIMKEIVTLQKLKTFDMSHLCVWVQLGLKSKEAHKIAYKYKIFYEEDSCIATEYERLCEI